MSNRHAIIMENVSKSHAGRPVLNGLNLKVEKGKTVFLFGDNGSGKTSLLKIAAALTKPTGGRAETAGADTVRSAGDARRRTGFASHEDCLYEDLSARANIRFFCALQKVADPERRAGELVEMLEISRPDVPCRELSAGMKKRASIARAVAHDPEVALLDEPFSGLDRAGGSIVSGLLRRLNAGGGTVLLSTHRADRAPGLADAVALLEGGVIASYGAFSEEFLP